MKNTIASEIVSLDRLDTSGNLNRLSDMHIWEKNKHRVSIVHHDLKAAINGFVDFEIGPIDYVFHLAAASHVDRSITNPMEFVLDNIVGTTNLLDWFRRRVYDDSNDLRFLYFSTDEVFGPASGGGINDNYSEGDRHNPGNPYAATKSAAESLCRSYRNTYKLPIMISNTMNVFGERQHPEKYLPKIIRSILESKTIPVHADAARQKPGSRFYIHARNVAAAACFVLRFGDPFERQINEASQGTYNIVGEREIDNLDLVHKISQIIGKPALTKLVDFHSARPGHDLRYALDDSKLASMGFEYPVNFDDSLEKTVLWYLANRNWLA